MMKTKIKRGVMLIALAIMSCLVFGLVACTKPEPSEPVLSGISITNKTELTAEWHAGDADRTIVVALSPESFTSDNTEITVTSSGEAVTVDTDDKFKLHAVADGKATVTVAAGDFTDSVEITVSKAVPPLGGIAINATQLAAEWYIGEADRTVTVTYDPASDYNASNTPATVTSSKPEIVKVDGMKLKAVGAGTAKVTVTAGGKTATVDITVKPVLQSITLGVDEHEYMTVGDADKEVTVSVLPTSVTGTVVTFVSDNEAVAKVEKVDSKYMLKAIAKGTAKITATVETANPKEGTKTVEFDVTVRSALTSVAITELKSGTVTETVAAGAATMYVNETLGVNMTFAPSDEYNMTNTKYALSLEDNEGVLELANNGKSVKALKAGTAKIKATVGNQTSTVNVTVKPVFTGVNIAGITDTYYKGDEIVFEDDFVPTFEPSGVVGQNDTVAFEVTSSDPNVAEVVNNTTTQAPEKLKFKGTGEVTITIRFFVTGNDRIGEAVKTVTKTVTAVDVSFADSSKVTLAVGEMSTRKASVTPDTYNAVYSVKDGSTDVITVDAETGAVTANAVGTAVVVATVQGGATAEYEVEVIAALSSIVVDNAETFDNDINYGAENIELGIVLDNGYTFNSAEISVIASDTDYVSVINTDGKYYAVINKITYGTEKSDGVTIEIKSDRFKNVETVTLNVKVAATAPVIELASETDIQAFAGDIVELPDINKSEKCDGDVAPTVTIKKGETEVAGAYNAQDNTLTIADQGEDYTVTYSLTDDRAASPLTTSKTINVKLYRKVFKAVTGKKVYDYPETVLDFDYGIGAKFVADANQTVSIRESDTVLGQFNMTASKYYYAEAVFTLKNPSKNPFVGLSHSLPVDSGTPTRWLAAMVDRGDRNFKIKDIDMTDKTCNDDGYPDCFNYNLKDVLYRNQLVGYGGLTDSDAHTVKVAVARVGEYFYTFINDQFVMVNTDKDYSEPTVPGIYGIKLSDTEAGVTIGKILWIAGQEATNTKLNKLYTDKYFGYHKWNKGPLFDKTDNGFTTSNDVGTSEDGGANGCYMSSGITPYVVFDGDFKVAYDYTNTEAVWDAVRWTRGALLNIVSALSHTDVGQQQVMASVGVRITGDNATSGNNVVYHGSPAMQESGVPFEAKDVNLSGDGPNQASFTDNNYTSEKPYTTLAVHNGDVVRFSVERRLKDDHAEYTMKITVNGNTVTRVMQVRCDRWSDPVMFIWGNQSNYGTVSNIVYQTI